MTGIMIFRPHLDRCRRLAVCHRGRRPSGNSLLLLSLRPQNYPAGGGPAPDYPCIGPAGHHHGLSGGGQTDRHHRSGLILPAAHCTKYLPRPEPSSRLPGGSRERHGHVPDAASAPGGNAPCHPHPLHGNPNRGSQRGGNRRLCRLRGRRRPGERHQHRHPAG